MSLIEKIKQLIDKVRGKKDEPRLLTDGTNYYEDKAESFRNQYRQDVQFGNQIQEEYSLEDCIKEYIYQYREQINLGAKKDLSRKAVTRMFSTGTEEKGRNVEEQEKLIDKITRSKKYRGQGQRARNGELMFYHITPNTQESEEINDDNPDVIRLYLNCERKNIARLTGEILKKLERTSDCPFKMKFLAESNDNTKNRRHQKNDKIVIYTNNEVAKTRIIENIMNIKREKPELFSSEKILPLIPKVGGFIGVTKQGQQYVSTPLYEVKPEKKTFYEKVSEIMEDCMIESVRLTTGKTDEKQVDDPQTYVNATRTMGEEQINQMVRIFKELFISHCEKSNLDIDYKGKSQSQSQLRD